MSWCGAAAHSAELDLYSTELLVSPCNHTARCVIEERWTAARGSMEVEDRRSCFVSTTYPQASVKTPCFPHAQPHVSRIPLPLSSQARRLHPRTVRRHLRRARSSGLWVDGAGVASARTTCRKSACRRRRGGLYCPFCACETRVAAPVFCRSQETRDGPHTS